MIKNVYLFVLLIALFSCKNEEKKDFVTFSGKITNHLGNDGFLRAKGFKKDIKITKDGVFKDTIHIKNNAGMFTFSDGNEFTSVYLKNGEDVHLTLDTKEFDESIKYTGKGAVNNNYLANKSLMSEKMYSGNLLDLDENDFKDKVKSIIAMFKDNLANTKGLDTELIELENKDIAQTEKGMLEQYQSFKAEKARFAAFVGKPSPAFNNYENIDGTKTSLKDLKGNYVYVDVWATWCAPCKAEIPYLKKLEEEFQGKKIKFVSISVDNGRGYKDNSKELAKEGWKKMIAEKQMKGVQLYADKAWKSDFVKGYKISGIPRFILIDTKGNVVDANASRPSNPKTKELLKSLLQ